jgi:ParB family chromosome partitioning protein
MGLKSVLCTNSIAESTQSVNINDVITGLNNRTVFRDAELAALAASMQEVGQLQPIVVRPIENGYQVCAGERRLRAAKMLGWETIRATVRDLSDEEAAAVVLIENLARVDVDPIDEAQGYQDGITRFGWSIAECARRANVSAERVRKRLVLLDLITDVQKLVRSGDLPKAHAEAMAGLDSNRQMIALRVINNSERLPTFNEFRHVCSDLFAEQNQDTLFDVESFWVEQIAEAKTPQAKNGSGLRRKPGMPALDKTGMNKATTGQALQTYIAQLEAAGMDDEALTVSTVLDELVRLNMARL